MYITLIIFWIGFLLDGKNIISQTSKFLLLVSYKSVDLIGPTFKLLIEGFLKFIVTFPLSRFMVSGFFGREVGFRGASCIISLRRSLSKKKIKNKFLNESIKVLFLNLEFSFLFFFKAFLLWRLDIYQIWCIKFRFYFGFFFTGGRGFNLIKKIKGGMNKLRKD